MPRAAKADWDAIEREYRAGILSDSELSRIYGVSRQRISEVAKRQRWQRDLSRRVKQATANKLIEEDSQAITSIAGQQAVQVATVSDPAADRAMIEAAAMRAVQLVREHRSVIRKGRELVAVLLRELLDTTQEMVAIEGEIRERTKDDRDSRQHDRLMRAVSLPIRAQTVRDLMAALKTAVTLERQTWKLDNEETEDAPASLGELIENVMKARAARSSGMIDVTPAAHSGAECDDEAK
jgi:hypothetical protein